MNISRSIGALGIMAFLSLGCMHDSVNHIDESLDLIGARLENIRCLAAEDASMQGALLVEAGEQTRLAVNGNLGMDVMWRRLLTMGADLAHLRADVVKWLRAQDALVEDVARMRQYDEEQVRAIAEIRDALAEHERNRANAGQDGRMSPDCVTVLALMFQWARDGTKALGVSSNPRRVDRPFSINLSFHWSPSKGPGDDGGGNGCRPRQPDSTTHWACELELIHDRLDRLEEQQLHGRERFVVTAIDDVVTKVLNEEALKKRVLGVVNETPESDPVVLRTKVRMEQKKVALQEELLTRSFPRIEYFAKRGVWAVMAFVALALLVPVLMACRETRLMSYFKSPHVMLGSGFGYRVGRLPLVLLALMALGVCVGLACGVERYLKDLEEAYQVAATQPAENPTTQPAENPTTQSAEASGDRKPESPEKNGGPK